MARKTGKTGESLRGFVQFCGLLRIEDGTPLRVHAFQKSLLAGYFAGIVQTIIILCKKNGKTTLLAALALYHAVTVIAAEVVIVAAAREQADILRRQAVMLLARSAKSAGKDRWELGPYRFWVK